MLWSISTHFTVLCIAVVKHTINIVIKKSINIIKKEKLIGKFINRSNGNAHLYESHEQTVLEGCFLWESYSPTAHLQSDGTDCINALHMSGGAIHHHYADANWMAGCRVARLCQTQTHTVRSLWEELISSQKKWFWYKPASQSGCQRRKKV